MTRITLTVDRILSLKELLEVTQVSETNSIIESTITGVWKKQTVPSIYLKQNDFFKLNFESAQHGMLAGILSCQNNLCVYLEFYQSPFNEKYDPKENKFTPLIIIERDKIIGFEGAEDLHFMAVKPKKSLEIMTNIPRGGVKGMIAGTIVRGAFRLAAKAEDDLVEKQGKMFIVSFMHEGNPVKLELIADSFYIDSFDQFLNLHWSTVSPPLPAPDKKTEGCFIATACYNDYDHPIVKQLRVFRDNYLAQKQWGVNFIRSYYKYSPQLSKVISRFQFLKLIIRVLIINPLYFLSVFLLKSKNKQ